MTDTFADGVVRRDANAMPGQAILDSERASYASGGPSLFWLAFRKVFLTVITLGIYRFWLTTHLRRHYWSAIRVQGDPFEYTGRGLEKLLGFLIALIILAVYLGIINMALAFAGLVSADDVTELQIMLQLSLIAALPLIYFATYRARRYILARTRWRGIRFGMDLAAWGYTWRACLLVLLSIVTLGWLAVLNQWGHTGLQGVVESCFLKCDFACFPKVFLAKLLLLRPEFCDISLMTLGHIVMPALFDLLFF